MRVSWTDGGETGRMGAEMSDDFSAFGSRRREAVAFSREQKAAVLVVDDHPLLRAGLVRMILEDEALELFGEAQDPGGAILAVDSDPPPDAVVLDLMLGSADGLELIRQLRMLRPALPILVISMHDEVIYAERALKAGAAGYVMKKEPGEEVLRALYAILSGEVYLSGRMKVLLEKEGIATDPAVMLVPDAKPPLSNRELHVYRLIGAGLATRQIAAELRLSIKTVETYRENLKVKLRLPNAAALMEAAKRWVAST